MLHSAVRSGAVIHWMKASAALRSSGVDFLKRYQLPPPVDGISTPQRATVPEASFFTSFALISAISFQVVGGFSGSRPASLNASLFQYMTMVERWNGMP